MTAQDKDRPRSIRLTDAELKEVVSSTVHETFITLGIDANKPLEAQKDFQHLREWRQTTEAVKRKGVVTAVLAFGAAIVGLAWVAFQRGGTG